MTRLFEERPYIIAECGSNWVTLEHCLQSIVVAREVGASAVKFQAFTSEALYGPGHGALTHELPLEWLPQLREKADACGIELMVTAFSPELVAVVDPFVDVHKVASSDAAWPQMLEAVARTGKPVLVSNGGKSNDEIVRSVQLFQSYGGGHLTLMHCVAAYPADCIIKQHLPPWPSIGLSDHTLGYTAAAQAARTELDVVEKHFTAFPDLDTPDRPHSLTPTQFKRMVDIIRGRPVESEETAMFKRHNRRLIATEDIREGEMLMYGKNFGAYRSLVDDDRGLSPFCWARVDCQRAAIAIPRGTPIGEGDFV